ncbi:hypothetical protein VTK73DRAFT_6230 [Phialemonium thermophilum]|uniref:Exoribonuclease phosphorolytic domain-containing protein n=1 Tax=Phialemonium thermophilum TaxID=223376 RepID=A0ABR3XWU7_9PEZI
MAVETAPEAALSVLPRADGSATFSYGGFTVTASVNGPVEAQRRDEHPYEAHVDVIVRPAAGVGGIRERHLESLLQASLSQIILVKNFPRSLIQIVLQIEETPVNDYANTRLVQAGINLPVIPSLFQAAVLALLSASVPMGGTAAATLVAALPERHGDRFRFNPSPKDLAKSKSVHALAFASDGALLLAESEGEFSMNDWEDVVALAEKICCGSAAEAAAGMVLDDETRHGPDMRQFIQSTIETKVKADLYWK